MSAKVDLVEEVVLTPTPSCTSPTASFLPSSDKGELGEVGAVPSAKLPHSCAASPTSFPVMSLKGKLGEEDMVPSAELPCSRASSPTSFGAMPTKVELSEEGAVPATPLLNCKEIEREDIPHGLDELLAPLVRERIKSLETEEIHDLFKLRKAVQLGGEDKIEDAGKLGDKDQVKKKFVMSVAEDDAEASQRLKRAKLLQDHKESREAHAMFTVSIEIFKNQLSVLPLFSELLKKGTAKDLIIQVKNLASNVVDASNRMLMTPDGIKLGEPTIMEPEDMDC